MEAIEIRKVLKTPFAGMTPPDKVMRNAYPKYALSQAGLPFTEDAKGEGHKRD